MMKDFLFDQNKDKKRKKNRQKMERKRETKQLELPVLNLFCNILKNSDLIKFSDFFVSFL